MSINQNPTTHFEPSPWLLTKMIEAAMAKCDARRHQTKLKGGAV